MEVTNFPLQISVVQVGDISYYVRNRVECLLPAKRNESNHSLATAVVIHASIHRISVDFIQDTFDRFLAEDDVFQHGFTENGFLVIKPSTTDLKIETLPKEAAEYLKSRRLSPVYLKVSEKPPQGPYFVIDGKLYQSWRLYPDDLGAFTTAVIPDDDVTQNSGYKTSFKPFMAAAFTASNSMVPVPSRIYTQESPTQPLAGMRITVKDNMHLRGVTTTLGSRSYAELYGKQAQTARYIDLLVQKGAVVLGKTKMSAFAGSEVPPMECIDYFPPWNPRGDGYQGPSGSSSGAAASVAGYPWVDVSLCTDTTGSMRHPASCHGVWGHRATWNSLPMDNIVPSVPAFDAIGIPSRSSSMIQKILLSSKSWAPIQKPTEILYPTDWYPCTDRNQQLMTEEFLAALETHIGIKCTHFSLSELWSQTGPIDFRDQKLSDFLRGIAGKVNVFDGYHSFDNFRREYSERFGDLPYVSPSQKERWEDGAAVSEEVREDSMSKINIFKSWVEEQLFNASHDATLKVMLVPQGRPGANYRDGTPGTKADRYPYSPIFVVSMIGSPQVIIPIGQNKYNSAISHQTEYAPIMTSLVGPKDSDLTLLDIAEGTLQSAGWQSNILTGRYMLHVGDNIRNAQTAVERKL